MNSHCIPFDSIKTEVADFSSTLGINPVIFRDAIQGGIHYFKGVNKFHPVTAGGSRAWEEIVAIVRESVVDQKVGWRPVQQNGIPMLVHAERGVSLVITSGDENTGLANETEPKTRNAKGEVTQGYIGQNYDLFDNNDDNETVFSIDKHQTWVLLYVIDKRKSEVRYELSLPTGSCLSGAKGKIKISKWQTRLLFPALPFNDAVVTEAAQEFTDDTDFFDVVKK